jgi:hypothetical protein
MRKVRDVLRLRHTLGMSFRQISEATGVGKTVVGEYVRRAGVIGITWPVPEEVDDAELERRLFPVPGETAAPRPAIDWRQVHEEMKRPSRRRCARRTRPGRGCSSTMPATRCRCSIK